MKKPITLTRETMNRFLPPPPEDFAFRMGQLISSLPRKGREPMKKKMSAGLILALALALIAVGALAAALLSGSQVVEQTVLPMALETQGENFTPEELQRIVAIAQENQVALPQYFLDNLKEGDGYYKQETIMALCKAEFGPIPAGWTIAQQAWFDEVMVTIGFKDYITQFVPQGEEITLEEAVAAAQAYIHGHFDPQVNLDDPAAYARYVTYSAGKDEAGAYEPKRWYVEYYPLQADGVQYVLSNINAQGIVGEGEYEVLCMPGVNSASSK